MRNVGFTASHGVGYPQGDPLQADFQGALICQEWKRFSGKPDPDTQLFSAADLQPDANIHGLIAFHFACYGLGTPKYNDFKHRDGEKALADAPFISRLPQKLLSHPKGGALAVIGHVDRAFAHSFQYGRIKQLAVFQSVLKSLIDRRPIGYAMEFFDQQYAELASDCSLGIRNDNLTDDDLSTLWTSSTDARNYAVFGDPAVTIAVEPSAMTPTTAAIEAKVWFKPSGAPSATNPSASLNLSTSIPQLQAQVKALTRENVQLKKEITELRQQLGRQRK